MKTLELFKGTGSFSKIMEEEGNECITLDILEKYKPTICCDIMEFDYKQFKPGEFDIIWCSPECKIFSSLQYTHIKNPNGDTKKKKWDSREHLEEERKKHHKFFHKTIEIISYLKPKKYFVENPKYSAIWKIPDIKYDTLQDPKFITCCYCQFGYSYKKPTQFLTNVDKPDVLCKCKKHSKMLGINSKEITKKLDIEPEALSLEERYSIPPDLIKYLCDN